MFINSITMKKVLSVATVLFLLGCAQTPTKQQFEVQTRSIEQMQTNYLELVTILHRMENDLSVKSSQIFQMHQQIESLSSEFQKQQQLQRKQMVVKEPEVVYVVAEAPTNNETPRDVVVLGAVETVSLSGIEQNFDARVDTGATTSSIDAQNIKEFERNGKKWVKFHISEKENDQGDKLWVEVPIIRYASVRQVNTPDLQKRPVVSIPLQLGNLRENVEFTLTDRSHMDHSVLLGREFLKDIAIVDVSKEHIHSQSES
jgi:hypothetical protein